MSRSFPLSARSIRGEDFLIDAVHVCGSMVHSFWRLGMFAPSTGLAVLLLAIATILPASAMGTPVQVEKVRPGFTIYNTDLDRKNNKMDDIIAIYGWVCHPIPFYDYSCPVVKHMEQFLKTFPQAQADLLRELVRLGAICTMKNQTLRCIYERHVDEFVQRAHPAKPVFIQRDISHSEITIENDGGSLRYWIDYNWKTIESEIPEYEIRRDQWMTGQ
jgi:hypothetical protein